LDSHLSQVADLFRHEFAVWYRRSRDFSTTDTTTSAVPVNVSPALSTIPESMDESESTTNAATPIAVTESTHTAYRTIIDPLLPPDWAYLPIICHYTRGKLQSSSGLDQLQTQSGTEVVLHELTNALRWLFHLVQAKTPTGSGVTTLPSAGLMDPLSHFARLCIACLAYPGAGGLGFGESGRLLAQMISRLKLIGRLRDCPLVIRSLEHVNLPEQCASFYDLYTDLLGHYAALSYSSPVFANLILWPCQQLCHMKYRRALWGEYQSALVSVRLRCDQVSVFSTSIPSLSLIHTHVPGSNKMICGFICTKHALCLWGEMHF
uniref:Conserved oligomeric Golgi complex subunit 8 n=1 Tax=Echinostoma caproni TaxID=27848 RepID=A0A183BAJ1_9TREM